VIKIALRTPTRTSATHAAVAASIPGHNGAAEVAARGIAEVDNVAHGVGGVVEAAIGDRGYLVVGTW
jgi:hypothetical protein